MAGTSSGSLINFAKELFNEEAYQHIAKLSKFSIDDFIRTRDKLHAIKGGFEGRIKEPATAAHTLLKSSGLTENDFFQTRSSIFKYFSNIATEPATAKLEPNSYVTKTTTEDKWHSGKITDTNKAKIDTIKGELLHHYEQIQSARKDDESTYILAKTPAAQYLFLHAAHGDQ